MNIDADVDEVCVRIEGREYSLGDLRSEIERMRELIREIEPIADILAMIKTGRFPIISREGG